MAYISWSDEYSVSVREFDNQHRTLVDQINVLHQSLLENRGRDAQEAILEAIVTYTREHFAAEERLMQRYRYPGYSEHKLQHDELTAKALELQERFRDTGLVLSLEILTFLKDWLKEHILGLDKEYGTFFNDNGVV